MARATLEPWRPGRSEGWRRECDSRHHRAPDATPRRTLSALAGGPGDPLVDTHGRVHRDLRISLTDRCSLRCTYCMPEQGNEWLARSSILSTDEIVRIATVAAAAEPAPPWSWFGWAALVVAVVWLVRAGAGRAGVARSPPGG